MDESTEKELKKLTEQVGDLVNSMKKASNVAGAAMRGGSNHPSNYQYSGLSKKDVATSSAAQRTAHRLAIKAAEEQRLAVNALKNKIIDFSEKIANPTEEVTDRLRRFGSAATASGFALKAWNEVQQSARELIEFNSQYISKSFFDTAGQAIRFGTSFSEAGKIVKENARTIALQGSSQFNSSLSGFKTSLEQIGVTMADGASMIPSLVSQSLISGVNQRDSAAIGQFAKKSLSSFQDMAILSGSMPETISGLQEDLLNSSDVFRDLLGSSPEQKNLRIQEMQQMRQKLYLEGLSLEQTQEAIKLQATLKRATVSEKIEFAKSAAIMAGTAGLSAEQSQRLLELSAVGKRRSDDEERELRGIVGLATKQLEQQRNAGDNSITGDLLFEASQGSSLMNSMMESAMQQQAAKDANATITDSEAAARIAAGQANPMVAQFQNMFNSVTSIMSGPFTGALVAATAALASLSVSAFVAGGGKGLKSILTGFSGMLTGVGGIGGKLGGGLGGGMFGGIKNIAGVAGSAGLNLAKLAGRASPLAALGLGGVSMISDGVTGSNVGSTLGGVAGGALGLIGGPVGAAIGATLGSYAGEWLGEKASSSFSSISDTKSAPDTINTAEESSEIVTVNKDDKQDTVIMLLQESVDYLRAIAEKENIDISTIARTKILRQDQYLSASA